MKLSKKTILSHCVTFCFGAIFAYALNDYANQENVPSAISKSKLRPIERTDDHPSARVGKIFESMSQMMDQQVGQLEDKLSGDIKVLEEEDSGAYRVIIKGSINQESLSYEINSGLLQLTGQVTRVNKTDFGTSRYISSFSRAFTLPQGIDTQNPKLINQEDELIIEFKKQ